SSDLVLLAAHAVVALVLARVDEPVVVELLQEEGDRVLVARLGGADEVVVGDVDRLEQRQPGGFDETVGPLLRLDPVRDRGAQDLLAVLIRSGEQPGVIARLTVPAGEHVGGHLGVGVPDVRHVVHIEDGRRDEEALAGWHGLESSWERRRVTGAGNLPRWSTGGPSTRSSRHAPASSPRSADGNVRRRAGSVSCR